ATPDRGRRNVWRRLRALLFGLLRAAHAGNGSDGIAFLEPHDDDALRLPSGHTDVLDRRADHLAAFGDDDQLLLLGIDYDSHPNQGTAPIGDGHGIYA